PGTPGAMGAEPTPGAALIRGSFPRSFLLPGTDTSLRVGGFIDLTGLYHFQGHNNVNPGTPSSNFAQDGTLNSLPIGRQFVPDLGSPPPGQAHARAKGLFTASPEQSGVNVGPRSPSPWGEARRCLEWYFSRWNNFSCQTLQQDGGDSLLPRFRFGYGTL